MSKREPYISKAQRAAKKTAKLALVSGKPGIKKKRPNVLELRSLYTVSKARVRTLEADNMALDIENEKKSRAISKLETESKRLVSANNLHCLDIKNLKTKVEGLETRDDVADELFAANEANKKLAKQVESWTLNGRKKDVEIKNLQDLKSSEHSKAKRDLIAANTDILGMAGALETASIKMKDRDDTIKVLNNTDYQQGKKIKSLRDKLAEENKIAKRSGLYLTVLCFFVLAEVAVYANNKLGILDFIFG